MWCKIKSKWYFIAWWLSWVCSSTCLLATLGVLPTTQRMDIFFFFPVFQTQMVSSSFLLCGLNTSLSRELQREAMVGPGGSKGDLQPSSAAVPSGSSWGTKPSCGADRHTNSYMLTKCITPTPVSWTRVSAGLRTAWVASNLQTWGQNKTSRTPQHIQLTIKLYLSSNHPVEVLASYMFNSL